MANLHYGVIASLINLPEDNSGQRFLSSLLASVGINVAAMVGINVTSQLHGELDQPPAVVVAKPMTVEFPALPEAEKRPVAPQAKPQAKPHVQPEKRHTPAPTQTKQPDEPSKEPEPTKDSEPIKPPTPPQPAATQPMTERPATSSPEAPTLPQTPASAQPNTATMIAGGGAPSQQSGAAQAVGSAHEATQSSEVVASVGAGHSAHRAPSLAQGVVLPGSRPASISESAERTEAGTILVGGGHNPAIASTYRPSEIGTASGVTRNQSSAARPGSSGFSATSYLGTGSSSLASAPIGSSVGRQRPYGGSASLVNESKGNTPGAMAHDEKGTGSSSTAIGDGNAAGAAKGTTTTTPGNGSHPQAQTGQAGSVGSGTKAQADTGSTASVETKQPIAEPKHPVATQTGTLPPKPTQTTSNRNEDAEPTYDPNPELPAELKKRTFQTTVRVKVVVDVDGSHTEELVQGTGDAEIDRLVLKTMRSWKWRSAYRDGEKAKMTRNYSFKINID